jgi:hypothetical protein
MSSRHLAELGFVLIAAAAVTLGWRAARERRRDQARVDRPAGLGEALASAMTTRAGKALVFGWWWWLGWHFLAR